MPNTNSHGPKRAILYARVSTDEQARTGYSLAQQLEALRASRRPVKARCWRSIARPMVSGITTPATIPS